MAAATVPSPLTTLLRPLIAAGENLGADELGTHALPITAALEGYEDAGIDTLAADLEAALPTQSLIEKSIAPAEKTAIGNLATELKSQIGNLTAEGVTDLVSRLRAIAAQTAATA